MAETVQARVLNGSKVVKREFIRRSTIMQARFDARARAQTLYQEMKDAGKKVTGFDTWEAI